MSDLVILILAAFFAAVSYLAAHAWLVIPVLVVLWLALFLPYERLNSIATGSNANVGELKRHDRVRPSQSASAGNDTGTERDQKAA